MHQSFFQNASDSSILKKGGESPPPPHNKQTNKERLMKTQQLRQVLDTIDTLRANTEDSSINQKANKDIDAQIDIFLRNIQISIDTLQDKKKEAIEKDQMNILTYDKTYAVNVRYELKDKFKKEFKKCKWDAKAKRWSVKHSDYKKEELQNWIDDLDNKDKAKQSMYTDEERSKLENELCMLTELNVAEVKDLHDIMISTHKSMFKESKKKFENAQKSIKEICEKLEEYNLESIGLKKLASANVNRFDRDYAGDVSFDEILTLESI